MARPSVSIRGQRGRGLSGHHRPSDGFSIEWYTPPGIFDALGLDFDLDPCAPKGGLPWIPAKRSYSIEDDGLSQPWSGRVWLNPPYGRLTEVWLARFIEHGHGIALVFARTETEWFQRFAPATSAMCLIHGRLTFVTSDRQPAPFNSGAPSLLLACGEDCADALAQSKLGMTFGIRSQAISYQGVLVFPDRERVE